MIAMTSVLSAEHKMFCALFDSIEKRLPRLRSLGEIRQLARLIEGILRNHAKAENDLLLHAHASGPAQGHKERLLHDHDEIDVQLRLAAGAKTVAQARVLLRAALTASRKHFAAEDRAWFPLMEKSIEPETLRKLGVLRLLRHHCPPNWVI